MEGTTSQLPQGLPSSHSKKLLQSQPQGGSRRRKEGWDPPARLATLGPEGKGGAGRLNLVWGLQEPHSL